MIDTHATRTGSAPRKTGRLVVAVSTALAVGAIAAPVAAAKTITVQRSFTLHANTTATYTVAQQPNMSLEDAGYVLTGPNLRIREDNLVDPYPHQPKDLGQISRDNVTILDAGIGRGGATPPLQIRVKTGRLSGTFKITLYLKQQGGGVAASAAAFRH
jgi:hypothetical protein